MLRFYCH